MKDDMSSEKRENPPSRLQKMTLNTTQRILLGICVVLLVLVLAVLGFRALFVQPELPSVNPDPPAASSGDSSGTTSTPEEPPEEVIDYGDGVQPTTSGERK